VLSLQKQFMKFQFKQFAWTHIALLLIVTTSQLIIRSIYEGLMWSVTMAPEMEEMRQLFGMASLPT
jgi:hypothetical protein